MAFIQLHYRPYLVYIRVGNIIPQRQMAQMCRTLWTNSDDEEERKYEEDAVLAQKFSQNMNSNKKADSESYISRYSRTAFLVLIHCICIMFSIFITLQSRPGSSECTYCIPPAHSLIVSFGIDFICLLLGLFSWHPFLMTLAVSFFRSTNAPCQ